MKTNVILKNGVNLVCEKVNKATMLSFLYFEKVHVCTATELMNECLANGWDFDQLGDGKLRLSVPNGQIKRYEALLF